MDMKKLLALLMVLAMILASTACVREPEPTDDPKQQTLTEPVKTQPTDPEPTDPEPTAPETTVPETSGTEVTDPPTEPTDPEPTEPEPTTPKPTEPSLTAKGDWTWSFYLTGEMLGVEDFDGKLETVICYSFTDRGYEIGMDQTVLSRELPKFEEALAQSIADDFYDSFGEGMTREELEEAMGDSILDSAHDLVAELKLKDRVESLIKTQKGSYRLADGKLHLTCDDGTTERYGCSLTQNTMTLTAEQTSYEKLLQIMETKTMDLRR